VTVAGLVYVNSPSLVLRLYGGASKHALMVRILQSLARKSRKSSFLNNVLIVMSGTAIAQVFSFVLSPVISRLFSPEDFGVFGSFIALLTVITAAVTLEYSQAIMLPKENVEAMNLFLVSCVATLVTGFFCIVAVLFIPSLIQELIRSPNQWFLWLLILATLFGGLNQTLQAWCVRVKAFRRTSASQVIRSFSANGLQIGFGYTGCGSTGLIVGNVLADLFSSLSLLRTVVPDLLSYWSDVQWKRMRQLATEYRDFPLYSASQNTVNALSLGLPVILLTHFYGIAVAGAYAFGIRIMVVPVSLVHRSLRQVLFQKASEIQHRGNPLLPLFLKCTIGLLIIGILPSLLLLFFAPSIFIFLFGAQWNTAGEFARFLSPWILASLCNLPSVIFARLIRIQRSVFLYELVVLCARFSVLVLGGFFLNALHAIVLFSLVGTVMNIFFILFVLRAIRNKEIFSNRSSAHTATVFI